MPENILSTMGIFTPILSAIIANSRILLLVTAVCVSLTCLVLLPLLWRRAFHPESWSTPWPEGSPELDKWTKRLKLFSWFSVVFLIDSFPFLYGWHRGQTNWQQTVATPGYMLMLWGAMLRSYIDARRPPKPSVYKHFLEGIQPIQSEHWGEQTNPLLHS